METKHNFHPKSRIAPQTPPPRFWWLQRNEPQRATVTNLQPGELCQASVPSTQDGLAALLIVGAVHA